MEEMRLEFESAIAKSLYALLADEEELFSRGFDGDYKILPVQAAWWGWQMSARNQQIKLKATQNN